MTTSISLIANAITGPASSGLRIALPGISTAALAGINVQLPAYLLPHRLSTTPGTISAADFARANQLFDSGNRVGAYLVWAQATGNPAFLNTAQISSGSGCLIGGPAIAANAALQQSFPDIYPGFSIEAFSIKVFEAERATFIPNYVNGQIVSYTAPSEKQAYLNARDIWLNAKGYPDQRLADLFPGNFFLAADAFISGNVTSGVEYWKGTQAGILGDSLASEYFGYGTQYGITYGQALELTATSGTRSTLIVGGENVYTFESAAGKTYVFRDADIQMCVFDKTPGIGIPDKPLPPKTIRIGELQGLSDQDISLMINGLMTDESDAASTSSLVTAFRSQMAGLSGEGTLVLNDNHTLVLSANGMQATIDVVDASWNRINARNDGSLGYADSRGRSNTQALDSRVLLAPLMFVQGQADAANTQISTTNTLSVTTTVGTNTAATQTSSTDAASQGVSATNGLGSSGSYSFGITSSTTPNNTGWDVNTAQGNYALAGYVATQGLRPGNGSVGLQVTLPPVIVTDMANVDYSLAGAAMNTTSTGLRFTLPVDPLILDLDGGGVALTSFADAPVQFDIDNDGQTQFNGSKEQTGWMAAGEGMVVQDLNGNGQIDGIAETLSEYYNGSSGGQTGQVGQSGQKRFASGFAALKSLDSNNDNQFTNADAAWSSLRVWVDANHDVKTDTGELKTFAQLGITSINLASTAQSGLVNNGNEVLASGTFTQTVNGVAKTKEALAARFIANPAGSVSTTTTTNGVAGTLTTTEAGTVNGQTTTQAKSYVSQNTNSTVSETLNVTTLGVNNIQGGAGKDTLTGDAGTNWLVGGQGTDSFNAGAGDDTLLIDAADTTNGSANINAGEGFDLVQVIDSYQTNADGSRTALGINLNMAQAQAEVAIGGSGADVIIGGGRSSVFVRAGDGNDMVIGGAANDALNGENGDDLMDGGAGNDLIHGGRGQDQILGGTGDDVLDGGLDDDQISGGVGNDVLIGGGGDDVLAGGVGTDVAQYSGSYADYRITKLQDANGTTTWRVVDTASGRDGADTLTDIEKLSFKDVSNVDLSIGSPLPVKDTLTTNSTGAAITRTGSHLISKLQLLANDKDWDSAAADLRILAVSEAKGGTVSLTASGDVLFTPDASYTGVMGFKYQVADAQNNITQVNMGTGASAQTAPMKAAVFLASADLQDSQGRIDPLLVQQWYLADSNVLAAWKDYSGKGVASNELQWRMVA